MGIILPRLIRSKKIKEKRYITITIVINIILHLAMQVKIQLFFLIRIYIINARSISPYGHASHQGNIKRCQSLLPIQHSYK